MVVLMIKSNDQGSLMSAVSAGAVIGGSAVSRLRVDVETMLIHNWIYDVNYYD